MSDCRKNYRLQRKVGANMISTQARLIFRTLKVLKFNDRINFRSPKRSLKSKTPDFPAANYSTTKLEIGGHSAYTIHPLENATNQHIIYFHGGGYSLKGSAAHFQLIKRIIDKAKSTVTYVDYPLAPEFNVEDTLSMAMETYKKLLELHPECHFILMGDSAGGGLALALSMMIRDAGLKQPDKIVLFSPWLDIALTNTDIADFEDRDCVLKPSSLIEIGKIYCGKLDSKDCCVSPMYGDTRNLGDIAIFYGTEEIFFPDCKALADSTFENTKITAFEFQGMQHDWVILPIPEGYQAIEKAIGFITEV